MSKELEIKNREVLELFVKFVQEGQTLYKNLANYISDPMIKDSLLFMAAEEVQHEIQFKTILEEQRDRKYGWEDNHDFRELIDKHFQQDIFPKLNEILEHLPNFEGLQKALDFALKYEERVIELYATLRKCCMNYETKRLMIEMESDGKNHCDYIQKLIHKWNEKPQS